MKYRILVDTYLKIESTTKRLEMTDFLVDLFKSTPQEGIDKIIYLTQGKLRPDYEGIELGLAEKLAIRAISQAYGKSMKDIEKLYIKLGDLGLVAEELCKSKTQKTLLGFIGKDKELSVELVYANFMNIASSSGAKSQDRKLKIFEELLNLAAPIEARYLTRTVVGKLRLGIADMTLIDALAVYLSGTKEGKDVIERAYSVYPDLGKIASIIMDKGMEGMAHIKVVVGVPIMSMLAERLPSLEEIVAKMGGRAAFEYKYDGLRIQAHISETKNILYSRRLEDITLQFPEILDRLKSSFKGSSAIFDGEAVPVNPNTGELQPFQAVSHRRGRKYEISRAQEEYPVIIFLFDILYLNGEDLTGISYSERRKILENNVVENEHVRLAQQIVTDDLDKITKFFEKAIEDGCEGLVAKNIGDESVYRAGAREFSWIKYKREYQMEISDTVDLVVIGAFSGRGMRKGTYGALLMASYNDKKDTFETVCKLGSGFTEEQLFGLPNLFTPYSILHKHPRVESELSADFWFEPHFVLELIGAEITLSPSHTCNKDVVEKGSGLSIRFPRFTGKMRNDKSPEEATTSAEILELFKNQIKKLAKS